MEDLLGGLQNLPLRIPAEHYDHVQRLTMTGRTRKNVNRDNVPFARYLDIWWLALCIGIQEGRRTPSSEWHTFVRAGEVLPSNPWRILQLQLLAVSETNDTKILANPSEIIVMANEYAATGLPLVISEVLGSQIPIWAMTEYVEKRLGLA